MATDIKNVLDGERDVLEANGTLMKESVCLQEPLFEDAEAKLSKLSLYEGSEHSETIKSCQKASPLTQESVWFKQHHYESAETLYQMFLAGTAGLRVAPGTPGKRHLVQNNRTQSKKQKHDQKNAPDFWNKKFNAEGASVLKTARTIKGRLEELEKVQQRKSQIIKDAASRVAVALEECQTRLSEELAQSSGQINVFRSLLSEVEAAIDKTTESLPEKKEDSLKTQEKYCKKMTEHLSKLSKDLNSLMNLCNCFQADVSKSDVNRIVGDVGKLSLLKKRWDSDIFMRRQEVLTSNVKSLLSPEDIQLSDSESSLEGSCSDVTENGVEKHLKQLSGRVVKSKKSVQNNKHTVKSNRNNASNVKSGRNKANIDSVQNRPNSVQNAPAAPTKRNAQGIQNKAGKRQDLFQFKGVSYPSPVPFLSQPGLLGPRPNVFAMQGNNLQTPFKFSHYMTPGQKQHNPNFANTYNSLSAVSQSGFGNANFNFSGNQPRTSPLDFVHNPVLTSMNQQSRSNVVNQMKQSKMYQQEQIKGTKKSNRSFGAKPGFTYSQHQNIGTVFVEKPPTGLFGSHRFRGDSHGNLEQQLNEMTQKIQQMQLDFNHNFKLQQLLKETERLKQLVCQKQHQQQDRFQQQFQLLINSFMQQQQQQQFQGPRSKMARPVQLQTSQKQQQSKHQQLQQYKKRKQNKVQQVKQEPQKQSLHEDIEADQLEQDSLTEPHLETVLQNGQESFALIEKKIISENAQVTKIGTFSPHAQGDKHKAGVSSIVVMENIGCVVVVDIINSCLKLYTVSGTDASSGMLSHHLVTRLELSRPYYMGKLNKDKILVSREGKLLTLIRVSEKRLQFQQDIKTDSQYYGLGYVNDNVIACAAFTDNRIDLLSIKDGATQTVVLLTQCKGPELVASVPSTGSILYLERGLNETVHLLGISQQSVVEFRIDLDSSPAGVWSIASISDKIVCCNKQSGNVKLFAENGIFLADIIFPPGDINQPFAITFCDSGRMYVANDSAWDSEYNHYITTDINVYSFS